jgi:predicted transcriptional regulator
MYRLNCHLSDDLGDRLANHCERSGMLKVAVVATALDQYLNEQEAKRKVLEQLSDPAKLTEICKIMGLSLSGSEG